MGMSNICVPVFLSLLDNIGACGNCYKELLRWSSVNIGTIQETGPLILGGKSPIVAIRSKGGGCPLAPCATGGSAARELTKKQSADYPRVGHVDEGSDHPAQRPVPTLLDLYLRMPCLQ